MKRKVPAGAAPSPQGIICQHGRSGHAQFHSESQFFEARRAACVRR